jgi:hypothetical protein
VARPVSNVGQVVRPGEKALAIFTDGQGLSPSLLDMPPPRKVARGESASWRVSLARLQRVDCVILYVRPPGAQLAAIWRCRLCGHKTNPDGRYTVELCDLEHRGTTQSNWPAFALTGANPVRYV